MSIISILIYRREPYKLGILIYTGEGFRFIERKSYPNLLYGILVLYKNPKFNSFPLTLLTCIIFTSFNVFTCVCMVTTCLFPSVISACFLFPHTCVKDSLIFIIVTTKTLFLYRCTNRLL